jgi:uncharacterized protein YjbK
MNPLSQNLEIEFKNMLTTDEYQKLIRFFQIPDSEFFSQENHYFDTPEFDLKEHHCALRVRQKGSHYEMTLKQPAQEGLLETNQLLTSPEAESALKTNKLPSGIIQNQLEEMGISFSKIVYFGSLTTKRAEIPFKEGLLVFDHSYYLNKEDFELEYEVENYQQGLQNFIQLLFDHEIPQRKTENKIRRFYRQKYLNH